MSLPAVVIAGRPNVGKSSLFNFIAQRRISIVEPTAGVTRDRVSTIITHDGHRFELIDTGGIGIEDMDQLTAEVERQIQIALEKADLIVFVTDVIQGIVPQDKEIAERLRRLNKPIILVANKADAVHLGPDAAEFYAFGFGEPILMSAIQSQGYHELLDGIVSKLPEPGPAAEAEAEPITFAIVGKRNAGKSTFINALVREERLIVSEKAGTTRDAVDVYFEHEGKTYIAIDTAGARKRAQIEHPIEFFSMSRAHAAIHRAQVVLMFFDATTEISQVDKKLGMMVTESMKPSVLVVNKWDLAREKTTVEAYEEYFTRSLPALDYAPLVFISAKEGEQATRMLGTIRELHMQATTRVSTADLNEVIAKAVQQKRPRPVGGKLPKVYYGTQAGIAPPTIVLFVNNPEIFSSTYRRFLAGFFRKHLPFHEIPVRILFRARMRSASKKARK
ncbi:MAG TPA: ribosome biogenesis GTPase Der [Planctomycetota bacterium]|nr:ribosome biogenesis GTPase Der [Planctomycetota bacterium]